MPEPVTHPSGPTTPGALPSAEDALREEAFRALVRHAARDPWVLAYFSAIVEAHTPSPEEREAIWRAFEAVAEEPPSVSTPPEGE
jgi:hypothetical protein